MKRTVGDVEFQKQYQALNKSQKEAVDAIEGPVMVIAGPGTGKTTILTLRIANILQRTDTPPSGILALTFTESGVKSMKLKLRSIIGNRADEVRIHTFHGFASSIISEFVEYFPHLSRSTQITDIEATEIVREILKSKKFSKLRPLGDPDFYLGRILGTISDAKKEALGPEDVRKFAEEEKGRIKDDPNSISSRGASKGQMKADAQRRVEKCEKTILFSEVYAEYEKRKKEDLKMDFDDLLYELLSALKSDKLLLLSLQEKFLYILVDEHQDTNDSQNLIVSYLASFFENPNLFVVGDEKQAIYRFQGASVENFLKFQNIWKDMKIISLKDNYRSHQQILNAVYSMIEKNYEEDEHKSLRVELKSGSNEKEKPIDLVVSENIFSSDVHLTEELKRIYKDEPEATVAIILRWNRDVDYILDVCKKEGLEVSAERGVDVFSHPFGVMFFTLLEYFDDVSNLEALSFTVASGLWGLSFDDSVRAIKLIKAGSLSGLEQLIPSITNLRREASKSGGIDFLIQIAKESRLADQDRLEDPQSSEVWRVIIDLAKDLAQGLGISEPHTLIKELLSHKKTSESKTIKIGFGDKDSKIQVMTAHSSKGLEFDYVFIPFALEEHWMRKNFGPSFVLPKERDDGDSVKDARRLFYVSITRARKHVVILSPQKSDSGSELVPLRFIEELDERSVNKILVSKVKQLPKSLSLDDVNTERKKELVNYSKNILLENGLSVTALNHYIECPSRFLYKSILKVPEAPNPISEKGIAMHKAISEVWQRKAKSAEEIKNTLDKVVKKYFEVSLLPKQEKELVLEELLDSSKHVATSLLDHFNEKGEISTDKWLEKSISLKFREKDYEFLLHGQMDSILSFEDMVKVFDYKTKSAMSVSEIKGETKNSDGNYFRQLVFYKILTESQRDNDGRRVEASLVFVKPDSKGKCVTSTLDINTDDEHDLMSKIKDLFEGVLSGEFINKKCSEKDCKYCSGKMFM